MPNQPPDDDAVLFYLQVVEPTVSEFLEEPGDFRKAALACLTLSAMADHFFHARTPMPGFLTVGAFRGSLRYDSKADKKPGEVSSLGFVLDIANAVKHVTRGFQGDRVGFSDVETFTLDEESYEPETDDGDLDLGDFSPPLGDQVMVEIDGMLRLVSGLVEVANETWRKKLGF
jgi:hypothetical protein